MDDPINTINIIKDYSSIIKDAIVSISAITAIFFAYQGLSTWRKELKGKSEYQKAKDVLKAVFKVRDAFMHVRNPAIFSYEYPEKMRDSWGHLKKECAYEGTAHVYEQRWKILDDAFRELEDQVLEAQVEWGPDFIDIVKPLRKCRSELLVTIQMMLERKKHPHDQNKRSKDEINKETGVLNHIGDSEFDHFTPQINESVELFEKQLRPHIKP